MAIDIVRRAEERDLPRVGELAGQLVRMHHQADPGRFVLIDNVEQGYARWFASELQRPEAVVLVANRGVEVVGYAYGRLEGRDWNLLLDHHGVVHDIYVDAKVRRSGAGSRLLRTLVEELEGRGAPRIVLSTMVANDVAQRLFRSCGFRPTMLEMTR
ncbi:MAG: GNAT family N-acetyltransferase [Myxococcota bacterium]|nr:GNAT family N-acetyltransferase [Myxococcota bacterium]